MKNNQSFTDAKIPCKGIVTCYGFKNDQGVSIALLRLFGKNKYPGVENAPFIFWENSEKTPDGRPAEEWEKDGYILVSVANSKHDDHLLKHRGEKTCSALLVAEDLGIKDQPYLKELLKATFQRDSTGQGTSMDIYHFLKLMHLEWGKTNPSGVMEWYLQAIEALIVNEWKFFERTLKEFKEKAAIKNCWHQGKKITIASFESDDENMSRFARSKHGAKADVTIQKNSCGHVYIGSKTNSFIDFDEIVRLVRIEENKMKTDKHIPEEKLKLPGKLSEVEEWYYGKNERRILNGSLNNTQTPATKIPFEKIISLVMRGLQKQVRYGNGIEKVKKVYASR
ncbi:MAG TPA: hypothetical protein VG621_00255 [Candidatus Paceibacterota bacterium]|nr:hypothetical protein [Candidatus Paceibacterota bacterium]